MIGTRPPRVLPRIGGHAVEKVGAKKYAPRNRRAFRAGWAARSAAWGFPSGGAVLAAMRGATGSIGRRTNRGGFGGGRGGGAATIAKVRRGAGL